MLCSFVCVTMARANNDYPTTVAMDSDELAIFKFLRSSQKLDSAHHAPTRWKLFSVGLVSGSLSMQASAQRSTQQRLTANALMTVLALSLTLALVCSAHVMKLRTRSG